MSKHPEHEDKDAAHGSKKPSDGKADNDSTTPSKTELIRSKLKVIAHYAMLGFAPTMSATALVLAVIAIIGNKSVRTELTQGTPKFESISTSLSASKSELEKIRSAMAQEKSIREEEIKKREEALKKQADERKKQDELTAKIIQSVSQLQVKAKISPTLADQLRLAASTAVTSTTAPAAAPAKADPPAAQPKPVEKKLSPQAQSIKKAIEKFNKD